MRRGKPGENGVRFYQRRGGDCHPITTLESPFDFGGRCEVMFVPRADHRNHATRVERKDRHYQRCPRRAAR